MYAFDIRPANTMCNVGVEHHSRRNTLVLPSIVTTSSSPAGPSVLVAFDDYSQYTQDENDQCCDGRDENVSLLLLSLEVVIRTRRVRTVYHPTVRLIDRVEIDPDPFQNVTGVVASERACHIQDLMVQVCVLEPCPGKIECSMIWAGIRSHVKRDSVCG